MQVGPVLRRLLSPGGFVLVALCFALPFLTVSCEAPGHTGSGTYRGVDLVVGGSPELSWDGLTKDVLPEEFRSEQDPDEPAPLDPQPLAVIAMILVLVGAGTALLGTEWSRALAGLACAAVAAMFLAGAQTVLRSHLQAELDEGGVRAAPGIDVTITDRYGFWLAIGLLLVLAAVQFGLLILASRRPPEWSGVPPWPGPPPAPPGRYHPTEPLPTEPIPPHRPNR